MWTDLKCAFCGYKKRVFIDQKTTGEELKMIKTCPCGKQMEDWKEITDRMIRQKIKEKSFYTLIRAKDGRLFALEKEGVEFERYGLTLYAYQEDSHHIVTPYCHVIDPETGTSIYTANCTLDTITRHLSRNAIMDFKSAIEIQKDRYEEAKKAFEDAERVASLDDISGGIEKK